MGDGSGMGERPCWVECQRSQPSLNNDAKREYLIDQSDRFPLYLPWLDRHCPLVASLDSLLQLSQRAVMQSFKE